MLMLMSDHNVTGATRKEGYGIGPTPPQPGHRVARDALKPPFDPIPAPAGGR